MPSDEVRSGGRAGWLPDPTGRFVRRYFDGATWTDHVANEPGKAQVDPYVAVEPSSPATAPGSPESESRGSGLRLWMILAGAVAVVAITVAVISQTGGDDDDRDGGEVATAAAEDAPASPTTTEPVEATAGCLDSVEAAIDAAEAQAQAENQHVAPTLDDTPGSCASADDFEAAVESAGANFQGLLPITVVRRECASSPAAPGCAGLDPPGDDRLGVGGTILCDSFDLYLAGLQLDLPFEGADLQQELADLELEAREGLEDEFFGAPAPVAQAIIDAAEQADDRAAFAPVADAAYEVCVEYGYARLF